MVPSPSVPQPLAVGSKVRAVVSPTCSRQAVIATLEQQDQAVVLWQDDYYYTDDDSSPHQPVGRRPCDGTFLVAPDIRKATGSSIIMLPQQQEATLPLQSLSQLLEFEQPILTTTANNNNSKQDASTRTAAPTLSPALGWKERGDTLMRLHDYAAAVVWYETALRATFSSSSASPAPYADTPTTPRTSISTVPIGATVLIKTAEGRVVVAEVDCVDETTVDVTLVETGKEMAMSKDKVLLVVPLDQADQEDLQERILLNLSRCLLQLADTTCQRRRRPLYFKSAVLGCTLVLALLDFRRGRPSCALCDSDAITASSDDDNNNNKATATARTKTALLLRGRAQAGLQKFLHARADGQRLQELDPVQGRRELQRLERQKAKLVDTNHRLARNVSQWVQSVLHNNDDDDDKDHHPEEKTTKQPLRVTTSVSLVSETDNHVGQRGEIASSLSLHQRKQMNAVPLFLALIIGAFLAWFVQKHRD